MRVMAKRAAEALGVSVGLPQLFRFIKRDRALILAYHNVVPDGYAVGGDRSLHLSLGTFTRQLSVLRRTHQVVSLAEMLAGDRSGSRATAAITFDDAYRGALELAIPRLAVEGLPATVFVAPGMLGRESFWWDVVRAPGSLPTDTSVRDHALDALAGEDSRIREWAGRSGLFLRDPGEWDRPATADELDHFSNHSLLSLGSHSWSHANLARVSDVRLKEELVRSYEWLSARYQERAVRILAYPYGRTSKRVGAAAAETGYLAGLLVDGGLVPRSGCDPFSIPRVDIPAGVSLRGFRLRTAGVVAR